MYIKFTLSACISDCPGKFIQSGAGGYTSNLHTALVMQVKKLVSVLTPSASDVIGDIESMLDVIRSLSSFKGLSQQLPSLEKALKFATQLLGFVRQLAEDLPIKPEQ